jgi:CTP:molybdopterin cytidylyltransferase MocA
MTVRASANIIALIMAAGKSARFNGIKQVAALPSGHSLAMTAPESSLPTNKNLHLETISTSRHAQSILERSCSQRPISEQKMTERDISEQTSLEQATIAQSPSEKIMSLVQHAYFSYRHANFNKVWVVLGANAKIVRKYLPKQAECIEAQMWQHGLGHSIANAIAQLPESATHVCIGLADQAAITTEHCNALIQNAIAHPGCIIAARYIMQAHKPKQVNTAKHMPQLGAPCIFPAVYFTKLAKLTGDKGARSLLRNIQLQAPQSIIAVDLPSAAIDIDTQEDLVNFL